MARNFDDILKEIHNGNSNTFLADESSEVLTIDINSRKITVPAGFETTVAVTNDYNSNEITLTIPTEIEGHDISSCQRKVIKWLNEKSKERGVSELNAEVIEGNLTLKWVIPPEATTAAGTLQFAICFCDLDANGRVLYKWNSLVCTDLKIAQGLDEVAVHGIAISKIITLDLYTRQFSIPSEFNKTIAYVGDNNCNTLTFRMDRYFNDIDFFGGSISIKYTTPDGDVCDDPISSSVVLESLDGNDKNDLVEFYWPVPALLTQKAGSVEIIVSLLETATAKIWNSAPLSGFVIGEGKKSTISPDPGSNELKLIDKNKFMALLEQEYGY